MRNHSLLLILTIVWLCSCSQGSTTKPEKTVAKPKVKASIKDNKPLQKSDLRKHIYSDTTYSSFLGKGITIQNSLPKGGSIEPDGKQYVDATGKRHAFAAFWTRIVNETNAPLTVSINFPADSFAIFAPPHSYLKLFLPTDNWAYENLSLYNYGLTGLKAFLDAHFNKATTLKKTINPNEEHIFYVAALSYQAIGTPRAAFIIKDQDLYYKMSISPNGSGVIPVGKITFNDNHQ
ncbi:MAG: hypothetical protein AAGA66_00830 [Bacteroidota bacterium]